MGLLTTSPKFICVSSLGLVCQEQDFPSNNQMREEGWWPSWLYANLDCFLWKCYFYSHCFVSPFYFSIRSGDLYSVEQVSFLFFDLLCSNLCFLYRRRWLPVDLPRCLSREWVRSCTIFLAPRSQELSSRFPFLVDLSGVEQGHWPGSPPALGLALVVRFGTTPEVCSRFSLAPIQFCFRPVFCSDEAFPIPVFFGLPSSPQAMRHTNFGGLLLNPAPGPIRFLALRFWLSWVFATKAYRLVLGRHQFFVVILLFPNLWGCL
jgi:hypothetical protein